MKNKNYNIPSKSIPAHKMQTFITLFLVDDPTEQNDLAKSKPDIVKTLSQRLQMLTKNALPPNYPPVPDPKSDPPTSIMYGLQDGAEMLDLSLLQNCFEFLIATKKKNMYICR